MKTLRLFALSLTVLGLIGAAAAQTTVGTPAAGYIKITLRGGSDSVVSVPLVKRSALMGRITAVTPNSVALAVTGIADNAFAPDSGATYYAQFVTGTLEGINLRITANTAAGVFTLDTNGDDLTQHALGTVATGAAGDVVRIIPYWTLADVFGGAPPDLVLDAVSTPLSAIYAGADEVLLFDNSTSSTDKAPAAAFAYVAGTGWRGLGNATTDAAGTALAPAVPFTVRRQNSSDIQLILTGYTLPERFLYRLPSVAAGEDREVAVALVNGGDVALSASNLPFVSPFGAIDAAADPGNARDGLLEYDGDHHGFALPPAHQYVFSGTDWFEGDVNVNDHLLQAASGFLLRLRGARPTRYWLQAAPP